MRKVCGPSCFFKTDGSKFKEKQVLYQHFFMYVVLQKEKERKKVPHELDILIMKGLFIVAHCWIFFFKCA